MNDQERAELRDRCRWLHGPGPRSPARELAQLAAWCERHDVRFDLYGAGTFIEAFEAKVAERLGFEAARFMPSGTMAQAIAMRLWCDRADLPHFGMHPTAHLELHEERAYAHLYGLRATLVGPAGAPLRSQHLRAVAEPLAALLTELPVREAGGQLPSWFELCELKEAARSLGVRLHLDGARLWECGPFYDRSYAEICDGFDSAYVSFYKGIGALPGAMLLGPREFVSEAVQWQRRSGGNLWTLTPNAASAAMHFEERLEKMGVYRARTLRVAELLRDLDRITILPDPPHTNMMHLLLHAPSVELIEARDRFAQARGVWLFGGVSEADTPGDSRIELYLGEGALTVTDEEIEAGFRAILA